MIETPPIPAHVKDLVQGLGDRIADLEREHAALSAAAGIDESVDSRLEIFHGYIAVLITAFVVSLVATPLMRKLAISNGIVDRPNARKVHRQPIAYLGGVSVFLGIMAGIFISYLSYMLVGFDGPVTFHGATEMSDPVGLMVPIPIVFAITVIMIVGLVDDIVGVPPWQKIGGQLLAAAALAYEDVGVKVAQGLLRPFGRMIGVEDLTWTFSLLGTGTIEFDLIYWTGTLIIAAFVLGSCNAANFIDGLDGLLTGVTSIAVTGLLVVALTLALLNDGPRDAQRIILCMAVLGGCLGFLPHNFNPANIFLGDCGSLLLGFCAAAIILTLGDTGKTHLVVAGLVIYAIPIIDTALAIVRRKLAGKSISDADDQHMHHMLKRALGVKGAVLVLYTMGIGFAGIGVTMSLSRARVTYLLAVIFVAYVGVTAIKIARRAHHEAQMQDAPGKP